MPIPLEVWAAHLDAEAAAIGPKVAAEVDVWEHRLAEEWRRRVTRRTGATAATIRVEDGATLSDAPHMHRLDAGFHGADSLGRIYDQAAQPALGPALELIEPQFETALESIVAESLGVL